MPLFGAFHEIPISDMVSLIGKSSGTLTICRFNAEHNYLMDVERGHATSLTFNGQSIQDRQQAASFLSELVRANDGEFVYSRQPFHAGAAAPSADRWYELELTSIITDALEMSDEIALLKPHFPEPDTRFVLNGKPAGNLSASLAEFLHSARPQLAVGCSANDLYQSLGLYLDQILLRLYKLRLARLIEPMRLAYGNFETAPVPPQFVDSDLLAHGPLLPIWNEPAAHEPEPLPRSTTPPKEHNAPTSRSKIGALMQSPKSLLTSR